MRVWGDARSAASILPPVFTQQGIGGPASSGWWLSMGCVIGGILELFVELCLHRLQRLRRRYLGKDGLRFDGAPA